jgi:hypothetical protein
MWASCYSVNVKHVDGGTRAVVAGEDDDEASLAEEVDESASSKLVEDVGEAPPADELVEACCCSLPKMFLKALL